MALADEPFEVGALLQFLMWKWVRGNGKVELAALQAELHEQQTLLKERFTQRIHPKCQLIAGSSNTT